MSWKNKVELIQQDTDEWMLRWRRFQTFEDYQIEKNLASRRSRNFKLSAAVAGGLWFYTAAPSTINRMFGAPHTLDIGIDATIKETIRSNINCCRRFTPNGYGRLLSVWGPTYFIFQFLESRSQITRMEEYLKIESVFGEQHRRRVANGKIDEFLCINVQASLPKSEIVVYSPAA